MHTICTHYKTYYIPHILNIKQNLVIQRRVMNFAINKLLGYQHYRPVYLNNYILLKISSHFVNFALKLID